MHPPPHSSPMPPGDYISTCHNVHGPSTAVGPFSAIRQKHAARLMVLRFRRSEREEEAEASRAEMCDPFVRFWVSLHCFRDAVIQKDIVERCRTILTVLSVSVSGPESPSILLKYCKATLCVTITTKQIT